MAAVTVFVDGAVRGDFPWVCARTGREADTMVTTQDTGGLPLMAGLLVLLGPPGWIALVVVAVLTSRRETLTVRIPYDGAVLQEDRRLRRFGTGAAGAGVAAIVLAIAFSGVTQGGIWVVIALGCLLTAAIAWVMTSQRAVRVHLDASRRWVTLANVHPTFVEAVLNTRDRDFHR